MAPVTFKDVKVAIPQGKSLREREAILTLTGHDLSLVDRSGQSKILSLDYSSILQAVFSRSKQPKWRGPDGKVVEASVDTGNFGFFRGDRNWLILVTSTGPVFLRFDDGDRQPVLAAVEQRIGITIQR